MSELHQVSRTAIVSRRNADPRAPDHYLQLRETGEAGWTDDPQAATAFESMREAMRAAARLPASICAYSVPRRAEVSPLS